MKTTIEEYITKNTHELDSYEPDAGHVERFEKLLFSSLEKGAERKNEEKKQSKEDNKKNSYMLTIFVSVAAVITLILLLRGYINGMDGCTRSSQVEEVVNYYNMQLKMEADKINKSLAFVNNAGVQEIKADVEAIISSSNEDMEGFCEMTENQQIVFIKKRYDAYMSSLQHIEALEFANRGVVN